MVRLVADVPFLAFGGTPTQSIGYNTGEYGAKFINRSGTNVTITELGRRKKVGNSQSHTLKAYDSAGELLGSVSVNMAGQPNNEVVYGALLEPIVVVPGGVLHVLSSETAGSESYWGTAGFTNTTTDIGLIYPAWKTSETTFGVSTSYSKFSFGPVNFKYSAPVASWGYHEGTKVFTTNGDMYQVVSALAASAAVSPATVRVPVGTFSWGAGGSSLYVPAGVTLEGSDTPGATIVNQHVESPSGYGSALITLGEGSTIKNITFNGANAPICPLIQMTDVKDWRVTGIIYVQYPGRPAYFVHPVRSLRGLIDNCTVTGASGGSPELVFVDGMNDSWDVEHSLGTRDNIFIESNRWYGAGYVCDAHSNARVVVRDNDIYGAIKIDGHGVWSNTNPQRGVRHMEIYNNRFVDAGNAAAIEVRGGTGRVFNNTSSAATGALATIFFITEYGVFNNNGAFTNYQTPANWPIRDQIGRGRYAVAGDWTTATSEPMYLWGNRKGGVDWPWNYKTIPAGAQTRFTQQGGTPPFGWEHVIQADRDYFKEVASFTGASGVGIGLLSARPVSPSKVGVGYWATDQGEWDNTNGATKDGQLSIWNGSAWVIDYTPYTFPHPMRTGEDVPPFDETAPTLLSATIKTNGNQVEFVFSEPVVFGAGGNGGWSVSMSGGAASLTYASGSDTNTLTYNSSRTFSYDETGTRAYVNPGSGIEDFSGNDLANVSSGTIDNISDHERPGATVSSRARIRRGSLGFGQ